MKNKQQGFTLIELSIVLVIIGLIVGGILVGQDLIKAAEVRATVGQLEKYNSALNTFRTKYNGLPGDLTNAAQFGLDGGTARAGTNGQGDGDGIIEGGATLQYENAWFWSDLSAANLIEGAITNPENAAGTVDNLPSSKLGRGLRYTVANANGKNFYYLSVPTVATGTITPADGVTSIEAFNIDNKIDDGLGGTGIVLSVDSITTPATVGNNGTTGAGVCYLTADGNYDTVTDAQATSPDCQLSIRFN